MPQRSGTSGRLGSGPISEQRRPGVGVEDSDNDLIGHQLDVDLEIVMAPPDALGDEFADNERGIVDEVLRQIGRIAQFMDQLAGHPRCKDRRVQTQPTSGGSRSGVGGEHAFPISCACGDLSFTIRRACTTSVAAVLGPA